MTVFTLRDIAAILDRKVVNLKNWTNGRQAITLVPSVRQARGRGHCALYSYKDMCLFHLVLSLHDLGLSPAGISQYMPSLDQAAEEFSHGDRPGDIYLQTPSSLWTGIHISVTALLQVASDGMYAYEERLALKAGA